MVNLAKEIKTKTIWVFGQVNKKRPKKEEIRSLGNKESVEIKKQGIAPKFNVYFGLCSTKDRGVDQQAKAGTES